MSQATPNIGANKSGLTYRQEDNDGKKALLNHHKGSSAPSYAEAGMVWLDDAATPWVMKMHDGADWIKIADINASTNAITPYLGTTALKLLNYASDTGAANAYALSPVPAISAYVAGHIVILKPANANTSASTLAISSLSATAIKMPDGTDVTAGVMNSSGVYLLVYNGTTFTLLNPTLSGAGAIIDRAFASYSTNTSLSTALPCDNSTPQKTEGTEILSASITPKSATSRIRVRFSGFGGTSGATNMAAALFIDTASDAVQATCMSNTSSLTIAPLGFEYEYVPGDTSSHTYKVRVGSESGTMRMNGNSSGRYFGGVAAATLVIEEIAV